MDTSPVELTGALEDYLETIFELVRTKKVARVKDIARARAVRAASVTPALRRLRELGLVDYVQREYVALTTRGEQEARRVLARHHLLTRFFSQILRMAPDAAERQACAMEHSLNSEGMDRLVRFFEFLMICPHAPPDFVQNFQNCSRLHEHVPACKHNCEGERAGGSRRTTMSISDLLPGQRGVVTQVNASGAVRQRLLDMGILPNVKVQLERVAPSGDPLWIRLHGSQLALRRKEARAVCITTP